MDLGQRLRTAAQDGMTFRDWMEACLYDPDSGYYTRRRSAPRTGPGPEADFATSPSLHPFMAQCVAAEIAATWQRLGKPEDFIVVEYGGGRGDLARDALDALQAQHGWWPVWHHVELSADHRHDQADAGGQERPIRHGEAPEHFTGFVVAHEFLDALPVHLMEWRKAHWAELYVRMDGDKPALETGFPTRAGTDAAPRIDVAEGHRVAAHAGAKAWLEDLGRRLQAGSVLIVDYGDDERVWRRDPEWGTIRTFRRQEHGSSPLQDPGEQDITASLDFSQLRGWAEDGGLVEASYESQEAFLMRHGALEAMNAIDKDSVEGASSYLRLRQLLLPTAMGEAFRVARYDVPDE